MADSQDLEFFRAWLSEVMERKDMKPAALAKAMGMSQMQVGRVLSGEQGPGNEFIRRLAGALGMEQAAVFRLAGEITDSIRAEMVRDDELMRAIRIQLERIDPAERASAGRMVLGMLKQYVRDHPRRELNGTGD